MSQPTLTVIVCAVADVAAVQATGPAQFWGAPVLSTNGLAKWAAWDVQISSDLRASLTAIPGVGLYPSNAAANAATGWID